MNGSLKLFAFSITLSLSTIYSCSTNSDYLSFRYQDFNSDWLTIRGDVEGAEDEIFDDSEWKAVHLPHDWGIESYNVQDSLHKGPHFKYQAGGGEVGFLRDGCAWYRKNFTLPELKNNQQIFIHFDGVQSMTKCWINGHLLGENSYGYIPFHYNISPYLNPGGAPNVLSVRAENPGENSRWYAGCGIYRQVRISLLNPVSADIWGTRISTPRVSDEKATVQIDVRIKNYSEKDQNVRYSATISSPDRRIDHVESQEIAIAAGTSVKVSMTKEITRPLRWSPDHPDLYKAHILIEDENNLTDRFDQRFGIRSISYTAEKGFLLNGEPLLLKGGNMHHDNGLLGASAFKDAEYRRVRLMKENGFNAIRTAHNPPSALFLDACDELGMLVIDEIFDAWAKAKRKNDYNVHFEKNWKKDLQAMIHRDKNHPSVIMWSIGNEVPERALDSGLKITEDMIAEVKKLDASRPVTESICNFWDNPGMTWPDAQPALELLDVSGYNYEWSKYEKDHQDYPDRVMYGSETFPLDGWENWNQALKNPWVIGGFVWTAMDYIGEAGIGHSAYIDPEENSGPKTEWPWYIAWCGDIDIQGNKKPQSYYRDVVWGKSKLEMMVHAPVPEGKKEFVSRWGWPDELNSWTWPEAEGEELEVRVFTNYSSVALILNDKEIGRKILKPEDKITAAFKIPYKPGELKAIAYHQDRAMDSISLLTAGSTGQIQLEAERTIVNTANDELIYVRVKAIDENGNWVPNDRSSLQVHISGPGELLAAGNGSPWIQGSFTDNRFELFQGRGQIIIRPLGSSGDVGIKVSSEQISGSEIIVKLD